MDKNVVIDLSTMESTLGELSDGELKMLFFVYTYMWKTGKWLLVHNQEMRDFAKSVGFERSAMCYSKLLSSLVEKEYLVRETKGVYYIMNNKMLFNLNSK